MLIFFRQKLKNITINEVFTMKKNLKFVFICLIVIGLMIGMNRLVTSIEPNSTNEEEYTSAKKKAYKKNTKSFILTPANEIEDVISTHDSIYLYFGRGTCPSCRSFVPELNKYSTLHKQTIYYIDTEDRENEEIKAARDLFEVKTVPALLKISNDGDYERFDSDQHELSTFLESFEIDRKKNEETSE